VALTRALGDDPRPDLSPIESAATIFRSAPGANYVGAMGESTLVIEPLDACFGAAVHDIELRATDDRTWAAVHEAWLEFGLLVFQNQFLTKAEQDAVALRFGDLEFRAAPIANIDADGRIHSDPDDDLVKSLRGNEGWHHDSTYMPIQAKGAVFTAEIVPPSGSSTGFADMRAAFDALDAETQASLTELRAHHSLHYSQGRAGYLPTPRDDGSYGLYGYHDGPSPLRPLVKIHPDTGRPNLCIGRHAHDIVGMDRATSEQLLDSLADAACQAPRVHFHQWSAGDVVLWDNRRLMHRAVPFDMSEPRRMWHTRIAGDPATERALNYPDD
jgi:alpha-ketoglutarate-dependent taurine dioxygenase